MGVSKLPRCILVALPLSGFGSEMPYVWRPKVWLLRVMMNKGVAASIALVLESSSNNMGNYSVVYFC